MRALVLAAARGFLGTPYRHQGSRAGVGCDCLGLVRGVWREVYGAEPETPGPYSADWAETGSGDPMCDAAQRLFRPIEPGEAAPGDLVLFRWREGRPAKHCGILDAPDGGLGRTLRLIHAYEGASVVSSVLTPGWAGRIAGVFQFIDRS
ncbi:NlpC/P60 family protein [Aureimonas sp. AU20]|uniref:NlpC/P60 family protein n=1 Tax=Aureimonas sp. AU20 TaxID=1349819 RepID=UPI0007852D13|nr:NlpC/P60 family protein [Aureimonas sp. AU20]